MRQSSDLWESSHPNPGASRETKKRRTESGSSDGLPELDQTTQQPSPKVEISLRKGRQQVFPFTAIDQEWEYDRDRLLVFKTIPFAGLGKGKYTVEFRISDLVRNTSVRQQVDFELTE